MEINRLPSDPPTAPRTAPGSPCTDIDAPADYWLAITRQACTASLSVLLILFQFANCPPPPNLYRGHNPRPSSRCLFLSKFWSLSYFHGFKCRNILEGCICLCAMYIIFSARLLVSWEWTSHFLLPPCPHLKLVLGFVFPMITWLTINSAGTQTQVFQFQIQSSSHKNKPS